MQHLLRLNLRLDIGKHQCSPVQSSPVLFLQHHPSLIDRLARHHSHRHSNTRPTLRQFFPLLSPSFLFFFLSCPLVTDSTRSRDQAIPTPTHRPSLYPSSTIFQPSVAGLWWKNKCFISNLQKLVLVDGLITSHYDYCTVGHLHLAFRPFASLWAAAVAKKKKASLLPLPSQKSRRISCSENQIDTPSPPPSPVTLNTHTPGRENAVLLYTLPFRTPCRLPDPPHISTSANVH